MLRCRDVYSEFYPFEGCYIGCGAFMYPVRDAFVPGIWVKEGDIVVISMKWALLCMFM